MTKLKTTNYCDPVFWKNMGNRLGWEKGVWHSRKVKGRYVNNVRVRNLDGSCRDIWRKPHEVRRLIVTKNRWKKVWHEYIEYIANGGNPNVFIKKLLK